MKIVHVIFSGLGGHGNVVFPLIENEFGKLYNNHLVFYGVDEVNQDYIQKCNQLNIPSHVIPKKQKRYLKASRLFKEYLTKTNPDVIIIHNNELIITASKFAKRNNAISIYVEHENNQSKSKFLHFLSKYALKKADAVVCLNENMIAENQTLYGNKGRVELIQNGIDTFLFKPTVKTDKIIFGLAGRMVEVKDHHNLLIAFSKIVNEYPLSELHLAGDGPLKISLKKQAIKLGISPNVKFLGLLSENEMVNFYQNISIYSHATHAENMSTAILQAMASELPIITSDIENNKLIVKDEVNGWLYQSGNHEDLYQKMKMAIESQSQLEEIGKKNRETIVAFYSANKMAQNYIQLIQSLT